MIISHWKGFEIDSSEGYYAFEKNLETIEEAWDFLERLLSSPLVWDQVSFTLMPREKFKQYVEDYLKKKIRQGIIREFEYEDEFEKAEILEIRDDYDYTDMDDGHLPSHIDPDYQTMIPLFLDIFHHLKTFLLLISVNFCLKPLDNLSENESLKFHSWFLNQFKNKRKAENRWKLYYDVKEDEFELTGNSEADYTWENSKAFEANFEGYAGHPSSFRINIPSPDPSLLVYLVSTIIKDCEFVFRGNHHWMDYAPEKLQQVKNED